LTFLKDVRDFVKITRVFRDEDIGACSDEEVEEIEHHVGAPLPAAYREFLQWMGRGASDLFLGSHVFYPDVMQVDEWARVLLENDSVPPLPPDALVFLMHQGYQFMFMRLQEGDDPPVYYYNSAARSSGFQTIKTSFSHYLLQAIAGLVEANETEA
jgi:hypothetical protein